MKISSIEAVNISRYLNSQNVNKEDYSKCNYSDSLTIKNHFAAYSALKNQRLCYLSFKKNPSIVEKYPIYSSLGIITPVPKINTDIYLRKKLQKLKKSDGEQYFKDEKTVSKLIDGLRSDKVLDFQLSAVGFLINNPKFGEPDDLIKFVSQINTVERGYLFVNKAEEYSKRYPDMTAEEMLAIIPRLEPKKIEMQEKFIDVLYSQKKKTQDFPPDDFAELLSSVNDKQTAQIQLSFFDDLMKRNNITPKIAINLVTNIEDRKHGLLKKMTGLTLLNKGIDPEGMLVLLPKVRNSQIAALYNRICDYLIHKRHIDSTTAASIMANISSEYVFDLHKNLIEEMQAVRDFESIDILKILGDIQTPEMAELKSAVIHELAKIDKLNGHDIMHIVTNVDNVYGAEIKVKTAQMLSQIEELSGDNIGYIVAGCHNEENSNVKCCASKELIAIPGMTGRAVTTIASRLLKKETAEVQISAAKELSEMNIFSPAQIASIVRFMRNSDFKEAKLKAIDTLLQYKQLDAEAIVKILNQISGETKDKYLLQCIDKMCKNNSFTPEDIANIASTMTVNKHSCFKSIDYFASIPPEIRQNIKDYSIIQDFQPFANNEYLNKNERRDLLLVLVKHHAEILDENNNQAIRQLFPFLPKNSEEYCELLPVLAKSIYRIPKKVNETTKRAIRNYPEILLDISRADSQFLEIDFENPENIPTLKYTREQFISDLKHSLSRLPGYSQEKMADQFGFELIEKDGKTILKGYPRIPDKYTFGIRDKALIPVTGQIAQHIKEFTDENQLLINNNEAIAKQLDSVFKAIPELYTLVGKQQNEWHHFDLFTHTLRVVQEVIKNDRFQTLKDSDKILLLTAAFMHDISKEEYIVDKRHSLTGAFDAHAIAGRFNFSESEKSKLFAVIRNHEWLKYYNKEGISELQKIERAKTIAFSLREGNAFDLVKILSEADLKGMKRKEEAYHLFKEAQVEGNNEVARYIRDLQRTAITLPQYKLPKANQLIPDNDIVRSVNIGGIRNKVIYLRKNMVKGSLPFDRNLDPNDFNVLVHSLDSEKNALIFQCLDESIPDSLISASYVNLPKGNWKTYRQQGFILDVNSDDIHAAYYKDYGSGLAKSIDKLKQDYLFEGYFKPQRDYISRKIKETLHIRDDDYRSLYQHIKNKSLVEIRNEYPFVSAALKKIFMEMQGGEYTYGRNYNEVLVTRPRIQGVFAYDRSIAQVPRYLRKYAHEQNIPIIIFLD